MMKTFFASLILSGIDDLKWVFKGWIKYIVDFSCLRHRFKAGLKQFCKMANLSYYYYAELLYMYTTCIALIIGAGMWPLHQYPYPHPPHY